MSSLLDTVHSNQFHSVIHDDMFDKMIFETTKGLENLSVVPPKIPRLDEQLLQNSMLTSSGGSNDHYTSVIHSKVANVQNITTTKPSAGRGRGRRSLSSLQQGQKADQSTSRPPGFGLNHEKSTTGFTSLQFADAVGVSNIFSSFSQPNQISAPLQPQSAPPIFSGTSNYFVSPSPTMPATVAMNNPFFQMNIAPVPTSIQQPLPIVTGPTDAELLAAMATLQPSVLVDLLQHQQQAAMAPLTGMFNLMSPTPPPLPSNVDQNLITVLSSLPPAKLQELLIEVQQMQQQQLLQQSIRGQATVAAPAVMPQHLPSSTSAASAASSSMANMLKRSTSLTDKYESRPMQPLSSSIVIVPQNEEAAPRHLHTKESPQKKSDEATSLKTENLVKPRIGINRTKASHMISRHLSVPAPKKTPSSTELAKGTPSPEKVKETTFVNNGEQQVLTSTLDTELFPITSRHEQENASHSLMASKRNLFENPRMIRREANNPSTHIRRSLQSPPTTPLEETPSRRLSLTADLSATSDNWSSSFHESQHLTSKMITDDDHSTPPITKPLPISHLRRKRPARQSYPLQQLIVLSSYPLSRQAPPNWNFLVERFPDVCIAKPDALFDLAAYKAPGEDHIPRWIALQ